MSCSLVLQEREKESRIFMGRYNLLHGIVNGRLLGWGAGHRYMDIDRQPFQSQKLFPFNLATCRKMHLIAKPESLAYIYLPSTGTATGVPIGPVAEITVGLPAAPIAPLRMLPATPGSGAGIGVGIGAGIG